MTTTLPKNEATNDTEEIRYLVLSNDKPLIQALFTTRFPEMAHAYAQSYAHQWAMTVHLYNVTHVKTFRNKTEEK